MQQKDWESAELFLRKLAYLDETNRQTKYGLAALAEQQGNIDRARHLMQQIAPNDRADYAPAHFWRAQYLLNSKPPQDPVQNKQRGDLIEQQLVFTVRQAPGHHEAHAMLGKIYSATGRPESAASHFLRAVDQYPDLRLPLAGLYMTLGKHGPATIQGEASVDYYTKLVAANDQNIDARLRLAASQIVLEQFALAEKTLKQGLAKNDDPQFVSQLMQDDIVSDHCRSAAGFIAAVVSAVGFKSFRDGQLLFSPAHPPHHIGDAYSFGCSSSAESSFTRTRTAREPLTSRTSAIAPSS